MCRLNNCFIILKHWNINLPLPLHQQVPLLPIQQSQPLQTRWMHQVVSVVSVAHQLHQNILNVSFSQVKYQFHPLVVFTHAPCYSISSSIGNSASESSLGSTRSKRTWSCGSISSSWKYQEKVSSLVHVLEWSIFLIRLVRNAIGAYGGSYCVYRALAVAIGDLPGDHRPNFAMTEPAFTVGPHPSWYDPRKIVSLDPWGHVAPQIFKEEYENGLDVR